MNYLLNRVEEKQDQLTREEELIIRYKMLVLSTAYVGDLCNDIIRDRTTYKFDMYNNLRDQATELDRQIENAINWLSEKDKEL